MKLANDIGVIHRLGLKELAPAFTFTSNLASTGPSGSASGVTAAPMVNAVEPSSLLPGHVLAVVQSLDELHHLDGIQIIYRLGFLVITDRRIIAREAQNIRIPSMCAPIRSDCMAIRLRSRQVNCITGSCPNS